MENNFVIDLDVDRQRLSTVVDGVEAYCTFRVHDGALDVRHTIVPTEIGGRGIASALVKYAYDYARNQGLICMATCSYAVAWLNRHPEYNGVMSDEATASGCAL